MMLSRWFRRQLNPGIGEALLSASSVCCLAILWAKLSLEASGGVGKNLWRFGWAGGLFSDLFQMPSGMPKDYHFRPSEMHSSELRYSPQ